MFSTCDGNHSQHRSRHKLGDSTARPQYMYEYTLQNCRVSSRLSWWDHDCAFVSPARASFSSGGPHGGGEARKVAHHRATGMVRRYPRHRQNRIPGMLSGFMGHSLYSIILAYSIHRVVLFIYIQYDLVAFNKEFNFERCWITCGAMAYDAAQIQLPW